MKFVHKKSTTNIRLNDKRLKAFSFRLGTRQGYPFLPFLFNTVLEIVTIVLRQDKDIKGIQIGKGNKIISAHVMILYIKPLKFPQKKYFYNL